MVPRTVAISVAQAAMKKLLRIERSQDSLVKKSSYQRSEKPSGSRVSIARVKVK
jgi:hypothetical protein